MRTTSKAITSSLLLAALALAGCGGSGDPRAPTRAERIVRQVALRSPVLPEATHVIPRGYTCDGKDGPLPLQWQSVPVGTSELGVLVLALKPVQASGSRVFEKVTVEWAAVGLPATLRQLAPERLPRGAIVGRNAKGSSHYSICPAKGINQAYLLTLFLLPRKLSVRPGFNDEALFASLSKARTPFGELFASYRRA
jgi:phosphatidylethanolamine-binding protein (PEBP) family uncharacterized protein